MSGEGRTEWKGTGPRRKQVGIRAPPGHWRRAG